MLISVQYARAVAALLVVYSHLRGFAVFRPLDFGEFGAMGVDIFFVISGFIMWETSRRQLPGDFAVRRVSRIVPAYWFYTTLLVVLALALPALTPNVRLDAGAILKSYLFIPYVNHNGQTNPILLQGWTLNYEMFFYAVFALSLFIGNRLIQLSAIAGFFVACAVAGLFVGHGATAFYLSTMPLEFVFGILVSVATRLEIGVGAAAFALLAGLIGLAGASIGAPAELPRFIAFGLPAAIALFGLVGLEPVIRRQPIRWLARIGDASYSLYLLHPFVLSAAAVMVKILDATLHLPDGLAGAALFGAIGISMSTLCAYLSFLFLEKPAGRVLNAWLAVRRHCPEPPIPPSESVKDPA